jgi:hypothetical protein
LEKQEALYVEIGPGGENPMSGTGMKQDREKMGGIRPQECEKH